MPKAETFDGRVPVTRQALKGARFLLKWMRDDQAQALTIRGDKTSRAVAESLATGDDPISRGLRAATRQATWGQAAGRKSWEGLTPAQRSERARKIATAGWEGKRKAERVTE
jgi:hypothetical protein